jgi:hypothetical protein
MSWVILLWDGSQSATTEAGDIVENRHQTTTGEDKDFVDPWNGYSYLYIHDW